jgi:hypothetical protein
LGFISSLSQLAWDKGFDVVVEYAPDVARNIDHTSII